MNKNILILGVIRFNRVALRLLQGDFFQVLATSFGLEIPIKDLLGCTAVLGFQGTLQIQLMLDLVYQMQRLKAHCQRQKFLFVDIEVRLSLTKHVV